MNNYIAKVTYERQTGDGIGQVTEQYLIRNACSFTEAEERAINHISPFANLDTAPVVIDTIRKIKLASIERKSVIDDTESFWRAKISRTTLDENTGKEKTSTFAILIEATSFWEANKVLQAYTEEVATDNFSPLSIERLDIVDIIETECTNTYVL